MNLKTRRIVSALLVLGVLLAAVWTISLASDDAADSFSITWWTTDGGGGVSAGGPYTLGGTAGQPDAGRSSGGDYALVGGFWAAMRPDLESNTVYTLHMPMVTR